jgi:hypothetical protein
MRGDAGIEGAIPADDDDDDDDDDEDGGNGDIEDDDALSLALRDMRVLLILDNAEDLIAADRAGFRHLVQQILLAAPEVRFLLTSRQVLGDPQHEYTRTLLAAAPGRHWDFGRSRAD